MDIKTIAHDGLCRSKKEEILKVDDFFLQHQHLFAHYTGDRNIHKKRTDALNDVDHNVHLTI